MADITGKKPGDAVKVGWTGLQQFDASAVEADKVRRRNQIRRQLKNEFNRLHYNPYKLASHVEILDPAIQRYMAMRASMYDYWKPSWRSFFTYFGLTFLPVFGFGYILMVRKRNFDMKCRTGEIPYELRKHKMVSQ